MYRVSEFETVLRLAFTQRFSNLSVSYELALYQTQMGVCMQTQVTYLSNVHELLFTRVKHEAKILVSITHSLLLDVLLVQVPE